MKFGFQAPPRVVLVTSLGGGLVLAALDQIRAIPAAPYPWLEYSDLAPSLAATAVVGSIASLGVLLCLLLVLKLRWFRGIAPAFSKGRWPRFFAWLFARLLLATPVLLLADVVWRWMLNQDIVPMGMVNPQFAAAAAFGIIWVAIALLAPPKLTGWMVVVTYVLTVGAGTVALATQKRLIALPVEAAPAFSHETSRVVMITIDTLRYDAVSWYSTEAPSTPNIDSLAEDSTVFRRAFSASSWTVPSVISLMTGLPAMGHLVASGGGPLPAEMTTLAEYLRDAGYFTAAIVDNPLLDPELGFFRGFEEYAQMTEYWPEVEAMGRRLLRRHVPGGFRRTGTAAVTAEVRNWLQRNRERDFFLWVHYYDPHVPYEPPARFRPPGDPPEKIGVGFHLQNEVRQGMKLTAAERDWIRKLYLAETQYVDEQVGAVLAELRDLDLYDGSLIALTSDHGEEFWEHGGYEHGHAAYDEVVRVPLMIKLPGNSETGTVDGAVSNRYLMPTILEQTGLSIEDTCASPRSLSEMWSGDVESFGPIALLSNLHYEEREAVRFPDAKMIRNLVSGTEELYDLAADPGETRSLVGLDDGLAAQGRLLLEELDGFHQGIYDCYGATSGEAPAMDPAVLERLKSLGYIQ